MCSRAVRHWSEQKHIPIQTDWTGGTAGSAATAGTAEATPILCDALPPAPPAPPLARLAELLPPPILVTSAAATASTSGVVIAYDKAVFWALNRPVSMQSRMYDTKRRKKSTSLHCLEIPTTIFHLHPGQKLTRQPIRATADGPPSVMCRRYNQTIVYRFELTISRIRRLFKAFATAAAIGGLIGSPAALADDEPPPPPPAPPAAPADVPEIPGELHCIYIDPWTPCAEVPSPPPPDTPETPDRP